MQRGFSTLGCVASVSARVSRESWDESKKRNDRGGGGVFSYPLPPPLPPFFFAPALSFAKIIRLETLSSQAISTLFGSNVAKQVARYVARLTVAELSH